MTQTDANRTEIGVFATGSLMIGPDAVVSVVGSRPIAIVTRGEIFIQGALNAIPDDTVTNQGNGGGFSSPVISSVDKSGKGPGAGGAPTGSVGPGGGAYCGKGGNATGGKPYGSSAISPLMGGSSGALGGRDAGLAGAGGGAIQLVSGKAITLTPLAKINVGGAGGEWLAGGGGSGGAVLLEAPTVTIQGVIAANGGGGGANSITDSMGKSATPNATAAPGAMNSSTENPGGGGSADTIIDGAAGQYTGTSVTLAGPYGGGGGGGAGRIRINTSSGQASITGVLSPSATTSCFSQGKLLAAGQ